MNVKHRKMRQVKRHSKHSGAGVHAAFRQGDGHPAQDGGVCELDEGGDPATNQGNLDAG